MKQIIRKYLFLMGLIILSTSKVNAQIPVIDTASIIQLIQQIQHAITMINQLQSLNNWEEIDHINLNSGRYNAYISQYRDLFDRIIEEIEGYQDGGLLGQIDRLDEVYFPYHNDWEENDREGDFTTRANPNHRAIKKQILWTRIQLKHAAKVAAEVRESIPQQEEMIQELLEDTVQAEGIMQSIKIGNQISGMVAKSLQTLNIQLSEIIQEKAASGLERNNKDGLQKNRQREAIKDFGIRSSSPRPAPLNPIGNY
jgi:hypothetical protein